MAIKSFKPLSASRRFMTVSTFKKKSRRLNRKNPYWLK